MRPLRAFLLRTPPPLRWVDRFIDEVRPFLFVREDDSLLIRRPNRTMRLNATGVRVLGALLAGRRAAEVARAAGGGARVTEIAEFLLAVRAFVAGTFDERPGAPGTSTEPFALGMTALPVLSEIAVTYRCNLRCAFCYVGHDTPPPAEMTTRDVGRVLAEIWRAGKAPTVSFTGGEPTARRDLPDLVRRAVRTGLRANLVTNGTLVTPNLARALRRAGLSSAQVSIEGATAATHDGLTGVPGSFAASLRGAALLAAERILVHTNTTICRPNASEVALLPGFVRERLGFTRLSMNLCIPAGSAAGDASLVVRYSEAGRIVLGVADAARRAGVEFLWYSPTPLCLFNPIAHGLGNKGCSACDGLLSVAPNGDVLPCSSWPEPVGNLLAEGARAVWASERARACREKRHAPPACRGCADFAACQGACPLYFRHLSDSELSAPAAAGAGGGA